MALNPNARPAINVRMLSRFPSRIVGATGIAVTTAGGVATVKMNVPGLTENNSTTAGNRVMLSYDPATQEHEKIRLDAFEDFFGAQTTAAAEAARDAAEGFRDEAEGFRDSGQTIYNNTVTAGTTAVTNINSAGATQVAAVAAQGVTSTGLVTTEGTTQVGIVTAAGASILGAGGMYPDTTTGLAAVAGNAYFDVPSPLPDEFLIRYQDVAGVANEIKRYPSSLSVNEIRNAGANRNLFPDPWFTDSTLAGGLLGRAGETPYNFVGSWGSFDTPPAAWGYPAGKVLRRPVGNIGLLAVQMHLDAYAEVLIAGDSVQLAFECGLLTAGSYTTGTLATVTWRDRQGTAIGAAVNIVTLSAGLPLNATPRQYSSGALTIPAGAYRLDLSFPWLSAVTQEYGITAVQFIKGAVKTKPVQAPPLANRDARIRALELYSPGNPLNGVLLRRTRYASATSSFPLGTTTPQGSGASVLSGTGSSFLAAACPVSGFNGISTNWAWTPSASAGPARIYVAVRTAAAGTNPLIGGKTLAVGYIDTDPASGAAGSEPIQLFDPVTGAPKTVLPADLLDVFSLSYYGVNSAGGLGANLNVARAQSHSNIDPSFPGYYAPNAPGGLNAGYSLISVAFCWYPSLLLMTSPVTDVRTPSDAFASILAPLVYEPPALIAMPKNVYCVVGREASLYYYATQHRDVASTNFRAAWSGAVPAGSGAQEERVKYVPTAAGTNTLTLTASRGELLSSTGVCAFITVAASAAAGTKVIHYLGDSLVENGVRIAALKVIEASQAVTNLTFIGSKGAVGLLNDGYSGHALSAFRGTTLGGSPNPFRNPGTLDFDYAYWKANTGVAFANPDFVFIEAGGVDVGTPTSDAAAQAAANAWVTHATFILNSIKAAVPTCKVVFTTKETGPVPGEEPGPVYGPRWRVNRNWLILAATCIAAFGTPAMVAAGVYVSPTSTSIDPVTGWARTFTPRSASVTRDQQTYATYAAMQADLAKAAGTLAFCTDVAAYFVKVGASGLGRWRDATERDGFIMRHTDTVHWTLGGIQIAESDWAVIKNFG